MSKMSESQLPEYQTRHYIETKAAREGLLGEMVTDEQIKDYLERSAEVYDSLYESQSFGDKYAEGAARQYLKFAKEERDLSGELQKSGLQGLDGYSSRELLTALQVQRDILAAENSDLELVGLDKYIDELKKHWQEIVPPSGAPENTSKQ